MLRRPLLAVALLCASAAACNAITGVDDLSIAAGSSATLGAGSLGVGGGGVAQGGTGGAPVVPTLSAKGVTIQEIAIYQGVKRSLMGGTPSSSGVIVPIVAGRDALVRVFVQTDATYDGSPVTAQLYLGQSATPIEVVAPIDGPSSDAALESTLNFDIPGKSMVAGLTYRVQLTQPLAHGAAVNPGASYPATGSSPLDVRSDGAQLRIALVPIQYGADGSKRLPDTSAAQLQGYKDRFFGTYPIDALDLEMHKPMPWTEAIQADGTGWDDLLNALADYRQQEGAPADLYYFGAFQPAVSFDQYCADGCVAGLGLIGGATDDYSRAAIGLGYSGDTAFTTAIHEVGHTQGRNHAPCGGAQNVDPAFPYSNGGVGVWGYDLVGKQLLSPTMATDMMGYCDDAWISDYTFKAIFDRMKLVNQAEIIIPEGQKNRTWERARLDGQGTLSWLAPITLARPPVGEVIDVTEQSATGTRIVGGQFFPYDHLPGGVLLWQKPDADSNPVSGIQVTLGGKVSRLTRASR